MTTFRPSKKLKKLSKKTHQDLYSLIEINSIISFCFKISCSNVALKQATVSHFILQLLQNLVLRTKISR